MRCETSGRLLSIVLFVVGMLMIYGSIVIIGWELPQGRIHSSSLLAGSSVFLVGIFCQWRCLRRQKELGAYEIDRSTRLFRKSGAPAGISFDAVSRLRLTSNLAAAATRAFLPGFSYWLFVHFKSGQQIRLAMGKKTELKQVLAWLKESGVPGVEWA